MLAWNSRAEDLWGLRGEEVRGQNFLNLDIGLPTADLRRGIEMALSHNGNSEYAEITLAATNRRGRAIRCKVLATPLVGLDREVRGVILMMDELPVA